MEYIKQFETHNEYENYAESENYVTPNVSYCVNEDELHFSTNIKTVVDDETRVIATFYISNGEVGTSIPLMGLDPKGSDFLTDYFTEIEVDGVVLDEITGEYEFTESGLHTVKYTLADQTVISSNAFQGCTNMINVKIPNVVESIKFSSFSNTNLQNIVLPDSVKEIQSEAFHVEPSVKEGRISLVLPEGVTTIPTMTFANYRYAQTVVYLGKNVTSFDLKAFANPSQTVYPYGDTEVVIYFLNPTPPTITVNNPDAAAVNSGKFTIVVPPSSVNAYKELGEFPPSWSIVGYDSFELPEVPELETTNTNTNTNTDTNTPTIPPIEEPSEGR